MRLCVICGRLRTFRMQFFSSILMFLATRYVKLLSLMRIGQSWGVWEKAESSKNIMYVCLCVKYMKWSGSENGATFLKQVSFLSGVRVDVMAFFHFYCMTTTIKINVFGVAGLLPVFLCLASSRLSASCVCLSRHNSLSPSLRKEKLCMQQTKKSLYCSSKEDNFFLGWKWNIF